MASQAAAYPAFRDMQRLRILVYSHHMGRLSIVGLPPSSKFAGTHLYTWVYKGTMVKCPAQAVALVRIARSEVQRLLQERKSTVHC